MTGMEQEGGPQQLEAPSIGMEYGEERAFVCDNHGAYAGKPYRFTGFGGASWRDPACPACKQVAAQREAAEKAQAEAEDKQRRAERRFILAGIPQRFRAATLENYHAPDKPQQRALYVAQRYVERFEERRKAGGGLILSGKPGTGKTHLLCAMAMAMPAKWSVLYTDCWSMVAAVKATFRRASEEAEEAVINRFVKPDLLLVDEVGVQYGSDAERAIIHRVLDLRYQAVKPSIVAGNVDLDGMAQYLGERAVSRLHDNGGMALVFDWADHRLNMPKQEQANG
jgi:DNA replication protein DnaC